jgi:UDP-3-O-[3-hydroxymyristoyl] N-acetylglucosamine deacetylase/3-hydroxyacyl-[acyl-carrier-protein] dehydratase
MAARSGHAAHVELVKKIHALHKKKETKSKVKTLPKKEEVVLDTEDILNILPHRYPFLMVDKVIHMTPRERIVGLKNVSISEPYFQGHFPGHPIMPGVLIVEAMAQTGSLMLVHALEDYSKKIAYFMGIDKVRFRKPVFPGDQLQIEVELLRIREKSYKMYGRAYVNGELVCEGELMGAIADRPNLEE